LDKLRQEPGDANELSLTLDVGLQPALEVDENVQHQADVIFEKEQAFVVEAANRKPKKKPELYVNDHG
jgi:mediator of replication checkpoint protein 1